MTDSKEKLGLAALQTEGFEFLFGDAGLGEEALGFVVETGEGGCGLRFFVAGLADALDELHGGAAILLGLLLGCSYGAHCFLRSRLLALGGFARAGGFGRGIFEEAAVLFEFSGEAG